MIEAQIQLQNALTTTFLANLVFLSEYDSELYHRIDELSRMIENGTYSEKYALDFIEENGDFDIYDIENNKYLYNKNPKRINTELIKNVEFNEKNSIFTLENIFSLKNSVKIDFNKRLNIEDISESNQLTQNNIFAYSNVLKDFLENKKKRLKKVEKFVFIGSLLGRHIPRIANKIDANLYLVCERNLEIFRLSLFTVDYTILAKNSGVIFSIMDDIITEEEKLFNFLNINFLENYMIKFSTTGINIEKYIDRLLSSLITIKPTSYDYTRYLYTFINRTTQVLNSEHKILLLNKIKEEFNLFENIPILFLAAGPSLDENIEWIKENQNKFIIVTIGAAYKKLLKNSIKIDMIFTLDEQFVLDSLQFDDKSVSLIDKDTIILASTITDKRILKKFNQSNLFFYEVFLPFYKKNIALSGFSVGELSVAFLLNMNIKEIYLLGLDLALNQKTGSTHMEDYRSDSKRYNLEEKQDKTFFSLYDGLIKVKGNLNEEVYTRGLFYTSIKYMEKFLTKKSPNTVVYNLSHNGAFFENSIPKKIDEVIVNNYSNIDLSNNLLDEFKEYSSTSLDNESKLEINKEIEFIRNFLLKDFYEYKKISVKDYTEFFELTVKLTSFITNYEFKSSSISQILRNYLQIILPYLSYHFNDLKIRNENKKVVLIKEIFIKQIEIILDDYILFLERVVK
jgi:hypothetical protein